MIDSCKRMGESVARIGGKFFPQKQLQWPNCGFCGILAALAIYDNLARKTFVATIEFQLHLFGKISWRENAHSHCSVSVLTWTPSRR